MKIAKISKRSATGLVVAEPQSFGKTDFAILDTFDILTRRRMTNEAEANHSHPERGFETTASVTRFGGIFALGQNFKSPWLFFVVHLEFGKILTLIGQFF